MNKHAPESGESTLEKSNLYLSYPLRKSRTVGRTNSSYRVGCTIYLPNIYNDSFKYKPHSYSSL